MYAALRKGIHIKITQCIFLQNCTTDFDETLHVAWVWLPKGFGNTGRSGYSPLALRVLQRTRKAKAASGRLSFERGYNQTCHYYHNLQTDKPKLHAKFHQNLWCSFGVKWDQDPDIV